MPSVRASCCPLPLATPSGECANHQSSVTLLCLNYKWGLFSMIKQICHASGGNMMECLPSGGWFSLGLRPRENHPPSGKHSIMLPPLAWHICIILAVLVLFCTRQMSTVNKDTITYGVRCTVNTDTTLYKYDIPVGFPPGITSPGEDCRSTA